MYVKVTTEILNDNFKPDKLSTTAGIIRDVQFSDPNGALEKYINKFLDKVNVKPHIPEIIKSGEKISEINHYYFGDVRNSAGVSTAITLGEKISDYPKVIKKTFGITEETEKKIKKNDKQKMVSADSALTRAKALVS